MIHIELEEPDTIKGFTLLEVMVALAILGMVLTGVMHVFSNSLAGIGKSELHTDGTLVARQVMEEFLLNPELEEGMYTGEMSETFLWQTEVVLRPVETEDMDLDVDQNENQIPIDWLEEETPVLIYEIDVTVTWPDANYAGRVNLTTLLAKINPESDEEDAQE